MRWTLLRYKPILDERHCSAVHPGRNGNFAGPGRDFQHREPRQSRKRRPGYNRNLIGGGEDRRERQRSAGEKCFEVVTDGEGPMAGAQPAQAMARLRLARLAKSPTLGGVAFVAPLRERDRCARTPALTNWQDPWTKPHRDRSERSRR